VVLFFAGAKWQSASANPGTHPAIEPERGALTVVDKGWVQRAPRQILGLGGLHLQARGRSRLVVTSYARQRKGGVDGYAVKQLYLRRPQFDDFGRGRAYVAGYAKPGSLRRAEIQSRRAFRQLLEAVLELHVDRHTPTSLMDMAMEGLSRIWPKESGYDEPVTRQDVLQGAARGLVRGLNDPYAAYYVRDVCSVNALLWIGQRIDGYFPGFRVRRGAKNEALIGYVDPISPAYVAGLRPLDRLVALQGHAVEDMRFGELVGALQQFATSPVRLDVVRDGSRLTFEVPAQPPQPNVEAMLDDGVLSLRVRLFAAGTAKEVADSLETAAAKSAGGLRGLKLDLRGNPGGNIEAAMDTAALFVRGDPLAAFRRQGEEMFFRGSKTARWSRIPIELLVDEGTDSAAVALAAVLQAKLRAEIHGVRTGTKGSGQIALPLVDGTTVQFTAGHVWVGDQSIDGVGVVPVSRATSTSHRP